MIVTGLDLSLTATGVARINANWPCANYQEPLTCLTAPSSETGRCDSCRAPADVDEPITVTTRTYSSAAAGDTVLARANRLSELAAVIVAEAATGADLVCVERPAYASTTGSVTDRAGLWWLVVARIVRGYQIPVVDVVNNHLKMYATGKGNAGKDLVLAETVRRYGHLVPTLASNDEADSLQLAALGWHHLTGAPLVDLPQTHYRALTAVKWPPHPERNPAWLRKGATTPT